jgi:hypothetical protein
MPNVSNTNGHSPLTTRPSDIFTVGTRASRIGLLSWQREALQEMISSQDAKTQVQSNAEPETHKKNLKIVERAAERKRPPCRFFNATQRTHLQILIIMVSI